MSYLVYLVSVKRSRTGKPDDRTVRTAAKCSRDAKRNFLSWYPDVPYRKLNTTVIGKP